MERITFDFRTVDTAGLQQILSQHPRIAAQLKRGAMVSSAVLSGEEADVLALRPDLQAWQRDCEAKHAW
jgi:hypothetical protein